MTVGSLFAGIGGFDLGFERAGFDVIWQVEINDECRKELARLWPDAKRYRDIRNVQWKGVESVDVVCGGFPCQDISLPGKGAGINGERSGLWWDMLNAASILRPSYVVVENVAALSNRGLGVVLGSLSEIGYDAEWQPLRASTFGAPHERERIFIIAYPRRLSVAQAFTPPDSFGKEWHSWHDDRWGPRGEAPSPLWTLSDEDVSGEADGLAFAYGNAVVPAVAEYVASCVMNHANRQHYGNRS